MPYESQPAFTPPDDMRAADKIVVQYVETTRITAVVSFDEARELFGLGGTPDNATGGRMRALAAYDSMLLAKLGPYAAEELPISWTIQKMNDPYGDV